LAAGGVCADAATVIKAAASAAPKRIAISDFIEASLVIVAAPAAD
jgi:hypothetical protein